MSSSSNASLTPTASPTLIFSALMKQCFKTTPGSSIITTFTVASVAVLLPVYVFILRLGFQQWRRQGFSTAAMSSFDLLTYHTVLMELLGVLGCLCTCCGGYIDSDALLSVGNSLYFICATGQLFLNTLTCAERHLAVVHPVTYRGLKGEKWNRARNGIIAFIWLLSILMMNVVFFPDTAASLFTFITTTVLLLSLVSGFSLSVLRVLIRAGPGDGNCGRQRVDQSKLRAFYVIVSVLVVLVFRLTWNVVSGSVLVWTNLSINCGFLAFSSWIGLPCSLLIPLLYLQRKGKLLCCKKKKQMSSVR